MSAGGAFGVGLGVVLMGALIALIFQVSSLRSGNRDLRDLAGAAEDKSRDQTRRLIEQLGQPGRKTQIAEPAVATEPQTRSQASPAPTSSMWSGLWGAWFSTRPVASTTIETKAARAEPSATEILERMRAHQAKPQLPPKAGASSAIVTSAPPSTSPIEIIRPSPELSPPLSRAVFATELLSVAPPSVAADEALSKPPNPRDISALARFLLSEHDRSPASLSLPPSTANFPPATPVASAGLQSPRAPPATAPQRSVPIITAAPTTMDARRRHASAAECTAIIEQAQLADLTDRDRIFLQEYCH